MEELDVSMFQGLPLPMRQSLTRQGIPNLLSTQEAATINLNVGDEVPQVQTVRSAQQARVQPGDQVGPDIMPLPVDPYEGNVPVQSPSPSPEPGELDIQTPDLVDPNSVQVDTPELDQAESDLEKILAIPGLTFERQKELLEMKGRIALERDAIQARTRENIARYNANALREAEVAKALTMVAYKANRPDAELVGQIMSPMSGLSSLYKAVSFETPTFQMPRGN
jgi:hypothetical protein